MLQVNNISFSYQKETFIENLSFKVEKGATLALIGESGCGKSTLLKLLYGIHDLQNGTLYWNETEILGPKYNLIPGANFMKYLAQDFDLMPFITVAENVGKFLSNVNLTKKKERINELLEVVEMTEFSNTKAKNLSGGQMQRIALARVLALQPEVLLLDEPFSHIDNFRKNSLRRNLFSYLKKNQITTLIATHDSTDVLSFADQVVVIQKGKIIAHDTPEAVYKYPKNKYIASLFGDVNEIEIDGEQKLIYPQQLKLVKESKLKVVVENCYYRGHYYLIEAKLKNQVVYFENNEILIIGDKVCIYLREK